MNNSQIKTILKIDLGISVTAWDAFIEPMIERAKKAIEEEGIHLQDTNEDGMLIEQYAAWLLRKRKENIPFPRMLRWQLNNRLLSERMNADDPDDQEEPDSADQNDDDGTEE